MTDKVQKIREEVERIQLYTQSEMLKQILDYIDEVQKEPVSDIKTRVKEIFDSCEKIDVSDGEKNRVAFGLLELEVFAKIFYEIGKQQEEPVSEDLNKAAEQYAYTNWESDDYHEGAAEGLPFDAIGHTEKSFKAGAKWQFSQLEKNRLAACDKQTEEEAEIEQSFVMGIIEKEHRQPTFDDAIKYGMRLQRENMMIKAVDIKINRDTLYDLKPFIHEKYLDYKIGDKCKMILIKVE